MATPRVGQRLRLKAKHQLACPSFLGYPLNTEKRAKNGHARWHQSGNRHCPGGHGRICRALKKYHVHGYDCPG